MRTAPVSLPINSFPSWVDLACDTAEDYLQAAPPPSTVVQPLMERELLAAVESNKQPIVCHLFLN
eukprot:1162027-Pelagomonas_calceolata.AAC.4